MFTSTPAAPQIETKFLCISTEQRLGSFLDGWKVVWCEPDRKRVLWHIMVLRPVVTFQGCCGPNKVSA